VLIYIDDILITSSSSSAVCDLLSTLKQEFAVKDLGLLNYFLGIEVLPNSSGFLLSQHRYILDILSRTKMTKAKPINCPMAFSTHLSAHEGDLFYDPTLFRSTVGVLQYLCITRPDISFCVNKLAQFMHNPTDLHWQAVKRLYDISSKQFTLDFNFIAQTLLLSKHTLTLTGLETEMIVFPQAATLFSLAKISSYGVVENSSGKVKHRGQIQIPC